MIDRADTCCHNNAQMSKIRTPLSEFAHLSTLLEPAGGVVVHRGRGASTGAAAGGDPDEEQPDEEHDDPHAAGQPVLLVAEPVLVDSGLDGLDMLVS